MYTEIEGDLLELAEEGNFDIIAHGCNCQTAMGGGIAYAIKNKWPEVFDTDRYNPLMPILRLGNINFTQVMPRLIVCNMYTQYNPGQDGDYSAISLCFKKLAMWLDRDKRVGIPLIGCGIAGLKWDIVSKIVQSRMSNHNITVVKYGEQKNKSWSSSNESTGSILT